MFDVLRVAGFATLALGAAGATGQVLPAVMAPAPVETVEPALTLPADVRALAAIEAVTPVSPPPSVEEEAPAASLQTLVRRHWANGTPDRETECLAAATYFESKGEPLEGQLAVANVILNRAESGRFASTVCGVVHQRGQFSFVRNGRMPAVARGSTQWKNAVAIAHIAKNDLWQPKVETALFFHAKRVSPGWRMQRVGAVGNHVFYR
jgi:N-acetylmuramoyl-L-alanine amidase